MRASKTCRLAYHQEEDAIMAWKTPTLIELCIGLEINGYLPAEF
jgi:coenzyme PQQ precursor peptide PqqA